MIAKERLYVWLNNGTFAEKRGCTHPQDIIAAAIGCSERTVIRCVQQLEAEGRVRVIRPRRRGACNTYFVACWNPAKRSGVLNVLEAVRPSVLKRRREREERQCQIKRTAALSRAHSLKDNPSFTASEALPARSRAREATETQRSTCMDPNRRLRAVSNPSLEAEPLVAELERKDQIIKTLQLELNRAMEDLAGMTEAARAAGRATVAAKGQRTRVAKAEARLEQLEAVVSHWRSHRPRTGPEFGTPGSKSFDIIEKALILMADDDAGPVGACNEAVDGLHLAPWQRYDQRFAKPAPDRILRNSVEHALGDEARIERCRRIARWVACNEARAFDMWRAACEVEQAWLRKWRQEHDRRDDAPRFIVDGIETRSDGR